MIDINLTQTSNITLKTKDKYCKDDIQIVQNLEEQVANPSEQTQEFTPSVGKNGISKFTINPIETETVDVKSTEENQVVSASEGKYIKTINVEKINLENKTIVPTKQRQTVVASQGYDGLKSTTIEPIPDEYIVPEGTLNINENGSYNVKDKESVNVAVPGEVVNLQDKTVTPTKEAQSVTADQGYTGLGTVEVGAIPNEYIIPSGNIEITENQVVDVTQYSQATISVPSEGEDWIGSMMMGIPVDYVDAQGSVTVVESYAFTGMNQNLNSIELPRCSIIQGSAFTYETSRDVNTIPSWYKGLKKASLPECETIGDYAFQKCFYLSEIYAPKLKTISTYAFAGCVRLQSLNLPELLVVHGYAFKQCSQISQIYAPKLSMIYSGGFSMIHNILEYSLPSLETIQAYVFQYNHGLVSFYAPKLSSLSSGTFGSCYKLVDIIIDYDNLLTIPGTCFNYCSSLSTFSAPNCTLIESGAFTRCISLSNVSFPICSSLGMNAFGYCSSLSEAIFPECTFLGNDTFTSCSGLTKAYFPKLSLDANRGCFMGCTSLTDVSLPLCKAILSSVFSNCINLSSLNLPVVSLIGSGAFTNCSSLSALILGSTSVVKLSASTAFNSTPMKLSSYLGYFGSIYVPSDLVDSYKASTNWTYFSDRITSIENLPSA